MVLRWVDAMVDRMAVKSAETTAVVMVGRLAVRKGHQLLVSWVGQWVVKKVERLEMLSVAKTAVKKGLPTVGWMVATMAAVRVVQTA